MKRTTARMRIYKMVEAGELVKPDVCPGCNDPEQEIRVRISNPDNYIETLEWLCQSCIMKLVNGTKERRLQLLAERAASRAEGKTVLAKAAHYAVLRAVQSGELVRPDACDICGKKNPHGTEAHHEDYLDPLEVDWLCPSCHRKLHWKKR